MGDRSLRLVLGDVRAKQHALLVLRKVEFPRPMLFTQLVHIVCINMLFFVVHANLAAETEDVQVMR